MGSRFVGFYCASGVIKSGDLNRRRFLARGAAAAGIVAAGAALAALPDGLIHSIGEPRRRGRLDDVEHVVILMQENRSFDHYYGMLPGVRGFGDTTALTGVFSQPNPKGGALLPFHLDTLQVDAQRLIDLDHSWDGTHAAWAGGGYDGWIAAKTEFTMAHFAESDIPFHHALADAFTICDHYFCSLLGPTTPNRLHLFTGTIDPDGRAGGPAIGNPDDYKPVYRWTTYPERLQAAGITWQVYANKEVGDREGEDGYLGDYGDNPLWLFHAYHDALTSSDPAHRQLAERASVHGDWQPSSGRGRDVNHVLSEFVADCRAGTLPQVSWIVAPYAYCEHPRARPVDGARYVDTVLRALFDNPALWESTVLFLNYDENDGFFDHVLPPVAPPGTPLEYVGGRPIGLGPRVPMTVISPWSRGGWVSSEVYDHTSVIRFLERWTGVQEPNISEWRRAVTGDLTRAFDFREHTMTIPALPDAAAMQRAVDQRQPNLPQPAVPDPSTLRMPEQPPGSRPARPLPYQPLANAVLNGGALNLRLENQGSRPVQLAVYSSGTPSSQLLNPAATSAVPLTVSGSYDVSVHGPNGFLRQFRGVATGAGGIEVTLSTAGGPTSPTLRWAIINNGPSSAKVQLSDALAGQPARVIGVNAGETHTEEWDATASAFGWYDLSFGVDGDPHFLRRFAGHLENGKPSRTYPGIAASAR
ncbi:MAG: phospholipase C, phosphocholine-specific [Pseudonocardia sp.]|nr:phospholipase C, phosphocholine-specific [Pseudonocardia sp.]